jgi:hypothetical protein
MKELEIVCPKCGNPINKIIYTEIGPTGDTVTLIVECWSGSLTKDAPRHLFKIVKWLVGTVYVEGSHLRTITLNGEESTKEAEDVAQFRKWLQSDEAWAIKDRFPVVSKFVEIFGGFAGKEKK